MEPANEPATEPHPAQPYPAQHNPAPQRLTRTRQGRVVAGVCAGLARATNTDPILFRVVLAVLFFFGGVGAFLYLIGWLLIPSEEDEVSPVEALLRRGRSSTGPVLTVALGAATFGLAVIAMEGELENLLVVGVALLAVVLLLRRDGATPTAPNPVVPPLSTPPPDWATMNPPGFAPHGPFATDFGAEAPPPPPPLPPAPSAKVGLITVAALVLSVVGLAVGDYFTGMVTPPVYVMVPLGITVLGLLIGSWFARPHLLIPLAIVLTLAVGLTEAAYWVSHRVEHNERRVRPATAGAVDSRYSMASGTFVLDLRRVDFAGRELSSTIELGAGRVEVRVPRDVGIDADVEIGAGHLEAPGTEAGGAGFNRHVETREKNDAGVIELKIEVGVGGVEIAR